MQVPFAGFAIDPGERIVAKLRYEVIALRLVAVPPAAFDAPGSREERDLRLLQPPRLGEPGRPGPGLPEFPRVPVPGLDAPPGVLGTMVRRGGEAINPAAPQPHRQPLDDLRPILGLGRHIAEEAAASRSERGEVRGLDADGLDRLL